MFGTLFDVYFILFHFISFHFISFRLFCRLVGDQIFWVGTGSEGEVVGDVVSFDHAETSGDVVLPIVF